MNKIKKKSRPISDVEWFVLWFVCSFIILKCLMIYQDNTNPYVVPDMKYLYIATGALLLWLVCVAKLGYGNIFLSIRLIPKRIKQGYIQQREDLMKWFNNKDLEER